MVCLIVCLMVCLMVWLCSGGLYQSEFYLFIKEWKKVEAEAPGSGREQKRGTGKYSKVSCRIQFKHLATPDDDTLLDQVSHQTFVSFVLKDSGAGEADLDDATFNRACRAVVLELSKQIPVSRYLLNLEKYALQAKRNASS